MNTKDLDNEKAVAVFGADHCESKYPGNSSLGCMV
jgi:hypothetical protein